MGCGVDASLDEAGSNEWMPAAEDHQGSTFADKAADHESAVRLGARGVLGGYERGRVWGWAQRIGEDQPATVRIEVDGVPVASVRADRYREDLVAKGLHRTGRAGFDTIIAELDPGAEVSAFIEGHDAALTNGPCVVQGPLGVSSCTEGTVRGWLGGFRDGQVWGWAQIVGDADPVSVRIEVDGEPVAWTIADRPRDDLFELGLHASGAAGFRVDVGELHPGSKLEAIVSEHDASLRGARIVDL